jgi:GntR family transcriptional regulator
MMVKRFFNRPLYLQLRDALVQRISTGDWQPGSVVPNEIALASEFEVSPGTMRKVLDIMESERLVTRKQGLGTFVNDPTPDELAVRFSNIRDADGRRITGVVETDKITQGSANGLEIARLHLQPQDQVFRIRRFHRHKERLYMVEDASLPALMFAGLLEKAGLADNVVALSLHFGLLLGRADERISISQPERAVTDLLGRPAGAPILMLDRVVFALDGRPVEWRLGYCRLVDEYYSAEMA